MPDQTEKVSRSIVLLGIVFKIQETTPLNKIMTPEEIQTFLKKPYEQWPASLQEKLRPWGTDELAGLK